MADKISWNRLTCSVLAFAFLALLIIPIQAQAAPLGITIEGGVGVWGPKVSGKTHYNGRELDFNDDLDLSGREYEPAFWLRLEHPIPILPDFKLDYRQIRASGSKTIIDGFTWGDGNYFPGLTVNSDVELIMADLTLYWHIPLVKKLTNDILDIHWGLTGRYASASVKLSEPLTRLSNEGSGWLPVPLLYLGFKVKPTDWLTTMVELRGIYYDSNKILEGMAVARVYPFQKMIFVGLGYHYTYVDLPNIGDFAIDLTLQGPFMEVGFTF